MEQVRIRHPEAGEAKVPASSVPHWQSRGWRPADQEPQDKETPSRRGSGGKQS
jgi:hypothetical protein